MLGKIEDRSDIYAVIVNLLLLVRNKIIQFIRHLHHPPNLLLFPHDHAAVRALLLALSG